MNGPTTSAQAAASITGRTEHLILEMFAAHPEWAIGDDELCEHLHDLYAPTVKSARSRLSGAGLLEPFGDPVLSRRLRPQIAWRLSARGRAHVASRAVHPSKDEE